MGFKCRDCGYFEKDLIFTCPICGSSRIIQFEGKSKKPKQPQNINLIVQKIVKSKKRNEPKILKKARKWREKYARKS